MNSRASPALSNPAILTPPSPFGYKTAWFAIHSEDMSAVAASLGLQNTQSANWEYGVWHAGETSDYQIFVTPPVEGWVLAVGVPILYEADDHAIERMVELSKQFGEVQFFGSMRISSTYIWACASKGKLVRLFYEEDGARRVRGEETAGEKELNLRFFDALSPESKQPGYWERKDLQYPDEEHVLKVAAKWSIDPMSLDQLSLPPSMGLLGAPDSSYPRKPRPIQQKKAGLLDRLLGR